MRCLGGSEHSTSSPNSLHLPPNSRHSNFNTYTFIMATYHMLSRHTNDYHRCLPCRTRAFTQWTVPFHPFSQTTQWTTRWTTQTCLSPLAHALSIWSGADMIQGTIFRRHRQAHRRLLTWHRLLPPKCLLPVQAVSRIQLL